jgi:hypothetical protein
MEERDKQRQSEPGAFVGSMLQIWPKKRYIPDTMTPFHSSFNCSKHEGLEASQAPFLPKLARTTLITSLSSLLQGLYQNILSDYTSKCIPAKLLPRGDWRRAARGCDYCDECRQLNLYLWHCSRTPVRFCAVAKIREHFEGWLK